MTQLPVPDPTRWTSLETELHAWRRAHPAATWIEIQEQMDARLAVARAELLGELVGATEADLGTCPACGGPLISRGLRERTLVTERESLVTLKRPYATCSRCGTGLFPPR